MGIGQEVGINIRIPLTLHKEIKVEVAKQGISLRDFVVNTLCLYFGMDPNGEAVQVDPAGDKGGEAA